MSSAASARNPSPSTARRFRWCGTGALVAALFAPLAPAQSDVPATSPRQSATTAALAAVVPAGDNVAAEAADKAVNPVVKPAANSVAKPVADQAGTPGTGAERAPADSNTAKPAQPETIQVHGRRNIADSEADEHTRQLLAVPGIMNDPLAAVYTQPGVLYAGGDFGGAPAVRGSSPEDNAFYVDGLPVGYLFHSIGFSIFDDNLVGRFNLQPAAYGAEFGNATGAVFDVRLRDPRPQPFGGVVDISVLRSGVLLESQVSDNAAFYASYRKGLLPLLFELAGEEETETGVKVFDPPEDDDYQFKYQWRPGDHHAFTVSAAGASDHWRVALGDNSAIGRSDPDLIGEARENDGFDSLGLHWQFSGENRRRAGVSVGRMKRQMDMRFGRGQFIDYELIQDQLRGEWQEPLGSRVLLRIGGEANRQDLDYAMDLIPYYCTDHTADCYEQRGPRIRARDALALQTAAAWLIGDWQISDSWRAEAGVRVEQQEIESEVGLRTLRHGDHRQSMPRGGLYWTPDERFGLHLKTGDYSRLPELEKLLPLLGNPALKPYLAEHHALGGHYRFGELWRVSLDVYEKRMRGMALALERHDADFDQHYSNDLDGEARGAELLVERLQDERWYGWLAVSASEAERTDTRRGITTPYWLDTPLVVNAVANFRIGERWHLGGRFSWRSGARYTPITGLRPNPDHPGYYLPVYGELNSRELPDYHRLDLQLERDVRIWGLDGKLTWAVLNLIGAENPSGYFYDPDGKETPDKFRISAEEGLPRTFAIGLKLKF